MTVSSHFLFIFQHSPHMLQRFFHFLILLIPLQRFLTVLIAWRHSLLRHFYCSIIFLTSGIRTCTVFFTFLHPTSRPNPVCVLKRHPWVCRVKHPLSWNISVWMEQAGLSSPWEPPILRLTANPFAFALKIPAFLGLLMSKNGSVRFHARQQWCEEAPWWVGGDHWSGLHLALLFYPLSAHDAQKAAAELLCLSECSLTSNQGLHGLTSHLFLVAEWIPKIFQ